jgi:hypothetical protein
MTKIMSFIVKVIGYISKLIMSTFGTKYLGIFIEIHYLGKLI